MTTNDQWRIEMNEVRYYAEQLIKSVALICVDDIKNMSYQDILQMRNKLAEQGREYTPKEIQQAVQLISKCF